MPDKPSPQGDSGRATIIGAVKTYLGFFALVVLVVESGLGALALKTQGLNQLVAIFGMLSVIAALIAVVSFFAYRKPDALLRSVAAHAAPDKQSLEDYCGRISGYWWERIKPDEPSALSFVEIYPDSATSTVKMKGSAYARDGVLAAMWESVASCVNMGEKKVFYYWKGWHPARPTEPYEGFGEISFYESENEISSSVGFFSDTNVTDMKSTTKKSAEFRRATQQEIQVMREGDGNRISDLLRGKSG
ncbi:MAG: hypothetical protein AB1831_04755 [Pseudomonadota bacterium]